MPLTCGTTRKVPASPASSSLQSTRRSRPSGAIRKSISSLIPRCVGPCFGGFRTASSSKSEQRRVSSTPCSMALGTRKVGADADGTHNNTLDRTAGSLVLAAAGQRGRSAA